jgi:hypothetical protein
MLFKYRQDAHLTILYYDVLAVNGDASFWYLCICANNRVTAVGHERYTRAGLAEAANKQHASLAALVAMLVSIVLYLVVMCCICGVKLCLYVSRHMLCLSLLSCIMSLCVVYAV